VSLGLSRRSCEQFVDCFYFIVFIKKMTEPIVRVAFQFHGSKIDHEIATVSSPLDINEVASDAVNSNTSFGYSGRHDHGSMPQLKCDPKHAQLISSIQDAKAACDQFLTSELDKQTSAGGSDVPVEKRARLDNIK
jgi:hypothetical protein